MNYTNLLRALEDIATRAVRRITEAQTEPHKGIDIDAPLRVLGEAVQAIAAIETAARPQSARRGGSTARASDGWPATVAAAAAHKSRRDP